YMGNAKILRSAAAKDGLDVFGGVNAPYIWVKTPNGLTSWQMFDRMLRELNVVITPGAGFGAQGEGYVRISAFNSRENAEEVARRGCARCSGGLTHGVLLAVSGGALALLRGKQDGPATGIAGNRGARRSSTGCVTDQAALAGATGSLDFRRTRSSKDRAGALLSRRIQLPRDSRHRRAQTEHAIAMLIAGTATVAGVVGR